jgi:hypothetical protein
LCYMPCPSHPPSLYVPDVIPILIKQVIYPDDIYNLQREEKILNWMVGETN